jgi:hypothetical protein
MIVPTGGFAGVGAGQGYDHRNEPSNVTVTLTLKESG